LVEDRRIVSIKVESEVICALSNGDIANDWVTTNPPNTPVSTFCVAFHIFVVGERRDFKFGVQIVHYKSQSMDIKLSLKGAWSCKF